MKVTWNKLITSLPEYERKLDRRTLDALHEQWVSMNTPAAHAAGMGGLLLDFLKHALMRAQAQRDKLHRAHHDFIQQFSDENDKAERSSMLLAYAKALGAQDSQPVSYTHLTLPTNREV